MLHKFEIGDRVRHKRAGWPGGVIARTTSGEFGKELRLGYRVIFGTPWETRWELDVPEGELEGHDER